MQSNYKLAFTGVIICFFTYRTERPTRSTLSLIFDGCNSSKIYPADRLWQLNISRMNKGRSFKFRQNWFPTKKLTFSCSVKSVQSSNKLMMKLKNKEKLKKKIFTKTLINENSPTISEYLLIPNSKPISPFSYLALCFATLCLLSIKIFIRNFSSVSVSYFFLC